MGRVAKVTISLPLAQAAFLDREQARTGTSRSELIARVLREAQLRLREERYAAAYARFPETADQLAMSDEAAKDFFGAPEDQVQTTTDQEDTKRLRVQMPEDAGETPKRGKAVKKRSTASASKVKRQPIVAKPRRRAAR